MLGERGADSVMLQNAMIGTRCVLARCGGLETDLEEGGGHPAAPGHPVRVYCREGNADEKLNDYFPKGPATLRTLMKGLPRTHVLPALR